MTQGFHLLKNPVEFVTATRQSVGENPQASNDCSVLLSGEEAKNIYETIINEPSTTCKKKCLRKRKASLDGDKKPHPKLLKSATNTKSTRNIPLTINDYFKAAESGSLDSVRNILESKSVDINAVDQYSWTALMMAAHRGHEEIVKYLLVLGADWEDEVDGSGYDAYDLACLGGHYGIAHMLEHRKMVVTSEATRVALAHCRTKMKREKLWCDVCKIYYKATSDGNEKKNDHWTSISHQFCVRNKEVNPPSSHFYLNSDNKGYKMLRKDGWDGDSGLGPSGSGQKYPVKTVLKRDRSGFGCEPAEARVTHFGSNDRTSIAKVKPAVKHKHLIKKQDEKQKLFEADFRRLFY